MAPSTVSTPASYRFIPIEATSSTPPSSGRRRAVNPKTQPVAGGSSFSLYQIQSPAHQASSVSHYNPPQTHHPYFFPAVLAHQPGAHIPGPSAHATPTPPNNAPNPAFDPPRNNSTPTPGDAPTDPSTASAQQPHPTTERDCSSSTSPAGTKPKKQNSASRPLEHPNPIDLGLTRISPPPECHYPNAIVAATVIHAWSTSRNFKLSRQKSDKNAAGEVYKQYYLCSRHGRPTNTHKVTAETRQRRQRKSERIGCPMGIVVRAVDAGNVAGDWTVRWQLEGKSEWHNHGPATEEEIKAEEERKERNERRKAAKGTGGGKRGRRPKDPTKPIRKRDRRKKRPGVEPDGIDAVEYAGGEMGHEQQLQQEHAHAQQQLQHELGTSSLHAHDVVGSQQQQQQQQDQGQGYSSRPLPSLWGLNGEPVGQGSRGVRNGLEEQSPYRGYGRSGMVYGDGQVGMIYR